MMRTASVSCLFLLQLISIHPVQGQGEISLTFGDVTKKMEGFVLELAREVERLHEQRCDPRLFQQCAQKSHDHCATRLSNQECPGGGQDHAFKVEYHFPQCGPLGGDCSSLYDFTTSSVLYYGQQVNENLQFKNPILTETTCYTVGLDELFVSKKERDAQFWESLGVGPRWNFFGTPSTFFRMYPARNSYTCSSFDPRTRSWYNGGSNGPRNVVILMDMSESMLQDGHLDAVKVAAKRVALTLTFRDRVALVPFGAEAVGLVDTSSFLYPGTVKKSRVVQDEIDSLEVLPGRANYTAAFEKAYEILEQSMDEGYAANCHGAILFFSDGNTKQSSPDESIDWIVQKADEVEQKTGHSLALLTYSVTSAAFDSEVHFFQKELACRSKIGIWSQIEGVEDAIDALWGYYNLFAMLLAAYPETVSWTEPYSLIALDYLTTAVSAPAYDRSVEPPVFLGVVAIPIAFTALDTALQIYGPGDERVTTIEQFIFNNAPTCPQMNMTPCLLESLQHRASGGRPICGNRTSCEKADLVQVEVEPCPGMEEYYPSDLWVNRDNIGVPFHERACCLVGETEPSDQCPPDGNSSEDNNNDIPWGFIVSVVGGLLTAAIALASLIVMITRHERREADELAAQQAAAKAEQQAAHAKANKKKSERRVKFQTAPENMDP